MSSFDARSVARIAAAVRTVERSNKFDANAPRSSFVVYGFTLLEDMDGDNCYAEISTYDGSEVVVEYAKLYHKWGILNGAKAGYEGDCYPAGEDFRLLIGPCIPKCTTSASIDGTAFPDGTVGDPYTHTVSGTGILGDFTSSGLPPGLSMDVSGNVTGTPTLAGEYIVVITGQGEKTGPGTVTPGEECTVSKAFIVTIS